MCLLHNPHLQILTCSYQQLLLCNLQGSPSDILSQSTHHIIPIYGSIIDNRAHIQYTILEQWFPYASDKAKSSPNPFKADSTFGLFLAENLPYTPAEIHLPEKEYLGLFRAHIGKMFTLCNALALIFCMLSNVSQAMLLPIRTILPRNQAHHPLPSWMPTLSHNVSCCP